jgi:hypothetical protein
VEEAQEAPDFVIGMLFINDTSAVVVFDFGASHSFISTTYVGKHNLPLALLKCQTIISSSGGDMSARHLCLEVNLKIRGGGGRCHTPFRERGNKASIRVPRMFKSHV